MDFLHKYWDKILLALALLALILSAMFLAWRIDALSIETREGPRRRPKVEPVASVNQTPYTNALSLLKEPVRWTEMPMDPFGQTAPQATEITNTAPTNVVIDTVSLLLVERIPFKLLFQAYTGTGGNFQLNFRGFGWTFFIPAVGDPVKDREVNTGYKITKFEFKTMEVNDPTTGGRRTQDVSVLTLQRANERPIPLTLGQEAEEQEPVGRIRCDPGWPGKPKELRVRRGDHFSCAGKTYNVFDITSRQMVIVDEQSGEKQTIPLGGPGQ